jgi:hypothetical protein
MCDGADRNPHPRNARKRTSPDFRIRKVPTFKLSDEQARERDGGQVLKRARGCRSSRLHRDSYRAEQKTPGFLDLKDS